MRLFNYAAAFLLLAAADSSRARATTPRGPAIVDPHTPVSSDRSVTLASEGIQEGASFSGFVGTAPQGYADASQAESADRERTAAGVWALVEREPMHSGLGRELVIGADSRVRVDPTTSFPNRAIGMITFKQRGRPLVCTGWLISENTVATSGSCLFHDGNLGGRRAWSTNVVFFPGRNGRLAPYGSCTAKSLHSVTGWTSGAGDERYDYGAVRLNCNIGRTTGWLGAWWQESSLSGRAERISGYPTDKPAGQQWRSDDSIAVTGPRQVFYLNDTFGGMAGAPVFQARGSGTACPGALGCTMAIHAWGPHNGGHHANKNHGTRVIKEVFDNLVKWRNLP